MIVVIGSPSFLPGSPGRKSAAAGLAVDVARGALDAGALVQLVGKVGSDPAGDALMLALAGAGIGHAAILRDPSRATRVVPVAELPDEAFLGARDDEDEHPGTRSPVDSGGPSEVSIELVPTVDSGDLELALGYLLEQRVIVVAERLGTDAMAVVAADGSFAGATLVFLVEPGAGLDGLPPDATVLEAPPSDPDGVFGRTVGRFAAALDRGRPGAEALAEATAGAGWQATGA